MSNKMAVSKDPEENWKNDSIQFPRLIAELQAVGVFNNTVIADLKEAMDLTESEIQDLIDRACEQWDEIKQNTP